MHTMRYKLEKTLTKQFRGIVKNHPRNGIFFKFYNFFLLYPKSLLLNLYFYLKTKKSLKKCDAHFFSRRPCTGF